MGTRGEHTTGVPESCGSMQGVSRLGWLMLLSLASWTALYDTQTLTLHHGMAMEVLCEVAKRIERRR